MIMFDRKGDGSSGSKEFYIFPEPLLVCGETDGSFDHELHVYHTIGYKHRALISAGPGRYR